MKYEYRLLKDVPDNYNLHYAVNKSQALTRSDRREVAIDDPAPDKMFGNDYAADVKRVVKSDDAVVFIDHDRRAGVWSIASMDENQLDRYLSGIR